MPRYSAPVEVHGSLFPGSAMVVIGGSGTDSVSAIQARDPGFDSTSFLSHVDAVRAAVVAGLRDHNSSEFDRFVGSSLVPSLRAQATGQSARTIATDAATGGASIRAAHTDATFDTIVAAFAVDGSVEDWTFQRSSQATTPAGGAPTEPKCPQCGAPLKLDDAGACAYCKAPVTGATTDWLLVRIQREPGFANRDGFSAAAPAKGGGVGKVAAIIGGVIGVAGLVIGIVAVAAGNRTTHAAQAVRTPFGSVVRSPAAPAAPAARALAAKLTLSGGITLSPSDLNATEFIIGGAGPGSCPAPGAKISSLVLNVTFDSGGKLQGAVSLGAPLAVGTADAASGAFHEIGATQATQDDQTWLMVPGQTGAVTVTVTSTGGTLKWQDLAAQEASHTDSGPSSGLLTWTCT
jgi:hypothetical protein